MGKFNRQCKRYNLVVEISSFFEMKFWKGFCLTEEIFSKIDGEFALESVRILELFLTLFEL